MGYITWNISLFRPETVLLCDLVVDIFVLFFYLCSLLFLPTFGAFKSENDLNLSISTDRSSQKIHLVSSIKQRYREGRGVGALCC